MAAASTIPFTAIENSSIARASRIGLAVLGALVVIKSHLNQKTGQCNPSYNTLANEAGVDRSTMIRYVKRLKAVNLIDPHLRFRDDGGYAANQYHFSASGEQPSEPGKVSATRQPLPSEEHGADTLPLVAEMPPPGGAPATPPGGNSATTPSGTDATALKNKTEERTSEPLLCLPTCLPTGKTEKQKTCQHPQEEIACLSENIIICNHCFALLDDNPTLATITLPRSPDRALPECEGLPEPEAMQPPVGNISTQKPVRSNGEKNNAKNFGTTASETPLRMAWKSPQIGSREEKTAKKTNPLVFIGKLLTGHLKSF
jgi:helix-turn-helix protein